MKDDVLTAKQDTNKNSCTLQDIELCYKDIHEIYTVDENGNANTSKEIWGDESYPAYYSCRNCDGFWEINSWQSREDAWKLAKEHLNG